MSQQLTPPDLAGVGHADPMTGRDDTQGVLAFADVTDGCGAQSGLASIPRTLWSWRACGELIGCDGESEGKDPVSDFARIGLANPVLDADVLQGQRAGADVVDLIGRKPVPSTRLSSVVEQTVFTAVRENKMVGSNAKPDAAKMMEKCPVGNRAVFCHPDVTVSSHSGTSRETVPTTSSSLPNPAGGFPTTIFLNPVHVSPPLSDGLSFYLTTLGGVKHGV